jgi:hypothetical protein
VGEILSLWKISLFIYIEETCVFTGRIPYMIEAGVSYSSFCYEMYVRM